MSTAAELRAIAVTDVAKEIPQEQFWPAIKSAPFVKIDGCFNARDLGKVPGSALKPAYAYRSGAISRVTDDGKATLTGELGVKRVFDLRTPNEREQQGPTPDIPGVEITWIPSSRPDSGVDLNKFIAGDGAEGYAEMYLEVVDIYQESWKAILEHVRDRPQEPFLMHCTAGRDRTGVISGLLLGLAGTQPDVIALDYLLSRIGTEPVRSLLLGFAQTGAKAESQDVPGFHNLVNLTEASWYAFLKGLNQEYGNFEKFVTGKLGFTEADLVTIKKNLAA